jgi:catechol 2,3-dioxygenase-like lactoylglutathione lyase family enzyme
MRSFLAVVVALVSLGACAQTTPTDSSGIATEGPEGSAVALRPYLLALSVRDLDASAGWYARVLGFAETERYDFPEDRMRLAFMEKEGFELELIELADAPPFSAPDPGNPATRRGLVKFAFYSGEIDALYNAALDVGAHVQSPLRSSNRTGGRFFILRDPDGNWVQVFGPAD